MTPGLRVVTLRPPLGGETAETLVLHASARRRLRLGSVADSVQRHSLRTHARSETPILPASNPVGPGTTMVLYGAAGALGQLMVPWAKHLGAFVIGVVANAESVAVAEDLGCDEVRFFFTSGGGESTDSTIKSASAA